MDFRGRFGFSEYNSDTYAPIAFNPLVTVAGIGLCKKQADPLINSEEEKLWASTSNGLSSAVYFYIS